MCACVSVGVGGWEICVGVGGWGMSVCVCAVFVHFL